MANYEEEMKATLRFVADNFAKFIRDLSEDGELAQLGRYFPSNRASETNRWNIEKAKTVLELLKSNNKDDIEKILSFLEHSRFGWTEDGYRLSNGCPNGHERRCKSLDYITSPQGTKETLNAINYIFLHKEYGAITTYLFGYCIAALFSSRMNMECLRVPYFLQIACERNSNTYRLIHKIVDICDVNTAVFDSCNVKLKYSDCNCNHITIFPSQSANDVSDLLYHRDIPVVIDGYESQNLYSALLRKSVNIHGRNKTLDASDRLNVLPIFICPNIKSTFKNVLSVDITGLDIDDDYMELIEANTQMLASWSYVLVTEAKEYFEQRDSTYDKIRHTPEVERPLFDHISVHINNLRVNYQNITNLTVSDIRNIGYLTYFFDRLLSVVKAVWKLSLGESFEYNGEKKEHDIGKIRRQIVSEATDLLVEFHNNYSPEAQKKVSINAVDFSSTELKAIQKRGAKYAADIIKIYQSFGVSIRILTDAEYKDERYVFSVMPLPGTPSYDISRYADEVRRSIGVEFLFPDISETSIKLIISHKPLKENSLRKMLENPMFKESKMEIPYAVGYDMMGEMVVADVVEFPHMLIGGTSGSGKSSALHSLLMSIVYNQPSDKVKLLLLDFGASRLNMFDNTSHMLVPTIRDAEKGSQCLLKLRDEVERRLSILDSATARDYDKKLRGYPYIICVIDEFPAFIQKLTQERGGKKASALIEDLLARARKIRIHLILSAQDASKESIGISTANLDARIAFKCTDWRKSQTIIDANDAAHLSGKGSLYFKCSQHEGLKRLQGSYMPPKEITDMLDEMASIPSNGKYEEVHFELEPTPDHTETSPAPLSENSDDRKLVEIVQWIVDTKKEKLSNNDLKKYLGVGYDKANLFLERLEKEGIVSPKRPGTKLPRQVYLDKAETFLKALNPIFDNTEEDSSKALEQEVDVEPIQQAVPKPKAAIGKFRITKECLDELKKSQPKQPKFAIKYKNAKRKR